MPRPYRLGERASQMQATRDRILEAAIELYTEQGVSLTTLRQVGIRADVAPGTLRNHFASRDELERAMIERLTAEAPLPDRSIFDGAETVEDRLQRLLLATGRFIEQAARLYRMWLREPMLSEPWLTVGAAYGTRWAELTRLALGSLADDADAQSVVRAVSGPPFWASIRAGAGQDDHGAVAAQRTTEEAAELIGRVLAPWFQARAAAAPGGPAPAMPPGRPRLPSPAGPSAPPAARRR